MKRTRWKIVESSSVTDDSLESIVNDFTAAGWTFEGIQFAMRESSKRPAMAFVLFTRAEEVRDQDQDLPVSPSSTAAPAAGNRAGGSDDRPLGGADSSTIEADHRTIGPSDSRIIRPPGEQAR